MRTDPGPGKLNRFDQNRIGRVKRSTSNATNSTSAMGVRRELINRKKMPGSVTSSLNSSESEPNAANGGQRSVYLHAACVADIPVNGEARKAPPPRALSAESRDNLAAGAGASNLQKSKKISRSISLLAPFKPKPVQNRYSEILYDNSGAYVPGTGKPPRPPPPTARKGPATMQRDKKSASSSDLLNDQAGPKPSVVIGEPRTVQKRPTAKVSRSVSMPKDTRLAGWFKKRKRV